MEVDKLKLLAGRPIQITDEITIYQPRISTIEEAGEQMFINTFWMLCSSAWDMPAVFADNGEDFMSIPDWEFFIRHVLMFTPEHTGLIFGDLDFSKLRPLRVHNNETDEDEIILVNPEQIDGKPNEFVYNGKIYQPMEFVFSSQDYEKCISYIRPMIGFQHKGRKAANKATAKILIFDDRKSRQRNQNKPYESMLVNAIVTLVNTEECSYTYDSAFDMTIYQLTLSLTQVIGKKQACALTQGRYSGFVDMKGIPSKSFDWTYSAEKYEKKGSTGKTLKDSLAPGGGSLNIKK